MRTTQTQQTLLIEPVSTLAIAAMIIIWRTTVHDDDGGDVVGYLRRPTTRQVKGKSSNQVVRQLSILKEPPRRGTS